MLSIKGTQEPHRFQALRRTKLVQWALPVLVVLLVWFTYQQGVTGDLFYDDRTNLDPLSKVETFADAKLFVTEGNSGPMGRPLALISFLPHAGGWPATSLHARQVNIVIHLFNGGLLFWLGYMVLRLRGQTDDHTSYWVALSAACLWLVMPLLASTTLITVQRMTSLATLFGLLGLIAFVSGYFLQARRPRQALMLQALGLGSGTLLAVLAKESGVLFPIYALVIDAVLLTHLLAPSAERWFRRVVLWLGLLALLAYLSPLYQDWFTLNLFRGSSSFERLRTEFVILWQYLYAAFFPQPTAFGPFHDDVELVRGWLAPTLALSAFVLLTALAFILRKRSPWLLFGLLWFFTGHLLESTVLNLELMFEHRNYIAIYGFCLALAATAWGFPGRYARLGPILVGVYGLMLWAVLYGTTSIWGKPLEAAENWVQRHPASPRAILHLSTAYYEALGNASYSLPLLDRAADSCPRCIDVQMQALLYACGQPDAADIENRFERVLRSAKDGRASIALLDSLYPWQELIARDACRPLTAIDIRRVPLILLENPAFASWEYRVHILFHAAYFANEIGDLQAAMAHLADAEALGPQVMPILQMQTHLLVREGRYNDALAVIDRRHTLPNRSRFMSDAALDELTEAVRNAAAEGSRAQ